MNPERALAKWGVDHADERVGNHGYIGVRRHDGVEGLLNPGSETEWSHFISSSTAWSPGEPALAKWLVPLVNAPGTMIDVSMPHRVSSRA